jgi:hypothetical protein
MNGMFIVAGVFFLLPCSLLVAAWKCVLEQGQQWSQRDWRAYSLKTALIVASCATLANICFFISWFSNGGSPHGMLPTPGLWKSLGPISTWTLVTSVLLATLGKGKIRFLMLGWAGATVFAEAMIFMLEMD